MTSDQQQAPTATVTTPTEHDVHAERVFVPKLPRGPLAGWLPLPPALQLSDLESEL